MLDVIEGQLTRIISHKPSKWSPAGRKFLVGKVGITQTVMGPIARPVEGAAYRFWGTFQDPRPPYTDKVFRFETSEPLVDRSAHGIAQCLADHVEGVGFVKAHALVAAFGEDTLETLRTDPERALEVKGITPEIVAAIRSFFAENFRFDPVAYAALVDLFAGQGFPKKAIEKLLELFGSDAPTIVRAKPYLLLGLPRIGWKRVDRFALEKVGFDAHGLDRQKWAIVEAFERLADDGHTFGRISEINGIAYNDLLKFMPDPAAWEVAEADDLIAAVDDDRQTWALASLLAAERSIAENLARIAGAARPVGSAGDLDADDLNDDQCRAAEFIRSNGVAILCGPPGCGKSWTEARIIRAFRRLGLGRGHVACPTGKAAKRAAELLADPKVSVDRVPATTIHRLLGPAPSEDEEGIPSADAKGDRGRDAYGFAHNEADPLDLDFLFVDEASMLDARLAAALLKAVPSGCRLVFVGDENQLPSVGPGSVLRDMIAAGVPVARLEKIVRSQSGRVIQACHAIKAGKVPAPAPDVDIDAGENWVHIEVPDGDGQRIADQIAEIYAMAQQFDKLWDIQVISAQKEKPPFISCEALNRRLCHQLNPHAARELAGVDAEHLPPFVTGDKVVRTKNGKTTEMTLFRPMGDDSEPERWAWRGKTYYLSTGYAVNGDLGQVEDVVIEDRDSWVVVRFRDPERLCRLKYDAAHLIQAYALTCHKAQGSGWPLVIAPVSHQFYWDQRKGQGIWSREQIYTSISRTERLLITIGPFASIAAAVGRPTLHCRRTTLADRIRALETAEIVR